MVFRKKYIFNLKLYHYNHYFYFEVLKYGYWNDSNYEMIIFLLRIHGTVEFFLQFKPSNLGSVHKAFFMIFPLQI